MMGMAYCLPMVSTCRIISITLEEEEEEEEFSSNYHQYSHCPAALHILSEGSEVLQVSE